MKNGHRSLEQRFGRRLRKARIAARLTQQQLGDATGLWNIDISQYERGLRLPRFAVLRRLCIELGVDGDYLLVRRGR